MASRNEIESKPDGDSLRGERERTTPETAAADRFGPLNWGLFSAALFLMILGYILLGMAGRDAAGALGKAAPLAIVGGLLLFGLGFAPRPKPPQ